VETFIYHLFALTCVGWDELFGCDWFFSEEEKGEEPLLEVEN
jgi:hypothetical protein